MDRFIVGIHVIIAIGLTELGVKKLHSGPGFIAICTLVLN